MFGGEQISNVVINGSEMTASYNQVVQDIYADEMYRSRGLVDEIITGERERSPVDEFATWNELELAQRENETAPCRSVGLVIETRPDHINEGEVIRIRRLGCTKVQIGFQSLNDRVLDMNKRGHDVAATRRAVKLLRKAGFKIHAHWMPNLYGSSPDADRADYEKIFGDEEFRPDELKIYPCSLIESAELMQRYRAGDWRPYTHDELLDLLVDCFERTPEYCRLTRVIRDIPGTDIVDGNKVTNFRQLVEQELARRGGKSSDIRAREIRRDHVNRRRLAVGCQRVQRQYWRRSLLAVHNRRAKDRRLSALVPARYRRSAASGRIDRLRHDPRSTCLRLVIGHRHGDERAGTASGLGQPID